MTLRVVLLRTLDSLLSLRVHKGTPGPMRGRAFFNEHPEILSFERNYGYFSSHHPIVARTTSREEDIQPFLNLLAVVSHHISLREQRLLMTAEILAKGIAYRDLKEGMQILDYKVDKVFDLWQGMPAFGLVSQEGSLLLFRGTDLSFGRVRGLASMVCDCDFSGVGYALFLRAQPQLQAWLKKQKRTQVMGFSLGGILAAYTACAEKWLIDEALAFSPPGFSRKAKKKYPVHPSLQTYIIEGDLVPTVGSLVGPVHLLSIDGEKLKPLAAHTRLITTSHCFIV